MGVHERGIELIFIRPGKPTENAYAESFNGRVREECLNHLWYDSVEHARELCEASREDYNTIHPHTSLGGLSPSEFLSQRRGGHARPCAASPLNDRGALDGQRRLALPSTPSPSVS